MLNGLTFTDMFDIYRVIAGTIAAELIFVEHAAAHRKNFSFRVLTGGIACFLFGLLYIPVFQIQHAEAFQSIFENYLFSTLWWILVGISTFCFVMYCYEITLCNLMFQCIFGIVLEHFISVILQYLICKKLFPSLQEKYPVLYVCVTIVIYGVFIWGAYLILVRRNTRGTAITIENDVKTFLGCGAIFLFVSVINDVTRLVFYWSNYDIPLFGTGKDLNHDVIPYYCILVNIIICAVILILQSLIYRVLSLQQEKKIMLILQREKKQQYLFSKENMDVINQKCHDLKRQIRALKLVNEEERDKLFAQTEEAVQFYDSQIRTGNNVLDTILTEKSIVCTGYGIRFSCNAKLNHTDGIGSIEVVDLYTLLSNALDNAIECAVGYEDKEKRTISVSIVERGSMLNVITDNYFEGEIKLKNGIPVTSKKDKNYHGYGVKSMQMIARKYDGDIRISVQNNIFSLHIMLPLEIG